jgi:hypothetical protein
MWDFEGRCTHQGECVNRELALELRVIDNQTIELKTTVCPDHPNESLILWPDRDDVVRIDEEVES